MEAIIELISTVGFPIALVLLLGWFIFKIYTDTTKANKENMEQVQARCKEREEKLYQEIAQNREVTAQAVATIGLYAERLEGIQRDINDIKTDITIITEHIS